MKQAYRDRGRDVELFVTNDHDRTTPVSSSGYPLRGLTNQLNALLNQDAFDLIGGDPWVGS